ncbi:Acetyl-coenzyme A synthetase [Streptomyces alboniger]
MTSSANPAPLWQPSPERIDEAQVTRFQAWAAEHHGAPADGGYEALHRWSVAELDTFWKAVTDWFDVRFSTPYARVLGERTMPGAEWFPGSTVNYAEHALRAAEDPTRADTPAILHVDENHDPRPVTWAELRRQVGSLAAHLRDLGVRPGDRVSGYLPNIPQAVVALLATAAVGGVWTSCAPDFGARSVLDRFQQVEPVVLFTVDGYRYGGKEHDRRDTVAELRSELPTLRAVVHIPLLGTEAPEGTLEWAALTSADVAPAFEAVPFDHPLWVLYSSGTTGLPKAIVQSQGGILVEHLKQLGLHCDLGPDDRFFWYTSTGWMMWNFLVSGLLTGTTIVLYDGSPGYPDTGAQWRIAERTGATLYGTSAAYVMACRKADVHPARDFDLSRRQVRRHDRLPPAPGRLPLAARRVRRHPGRPLDGLGQWRHRRLLLLRGRRAHAPRPHGKPQPIDREVTPRPVSTHASSGSDAASPQTPQLLPSARAASAESATRSSSAGCHGSCRRDTAPTCRSAAKAYCARSLVPSERNSTSCRIERAAEPPTESRPWCRTSPAGPPRGTRPRNALASVRSATIGAMTSR